MNPNELIGKPLVVYIDGARRQIGTIIEAKIVNGKLFTASDLNLEANADA